LQTHGAISFRDLSKRVSATWSRLPDSAKAVFRDIAAQDLTRYKREMAHLTVRLHGLKPVPNPAEETYDQQC